MQKFARNNFKQNTTLVDTRASAHISSLKEGDVRVINFGGTEECGKNMTAIEYKDSIIIINAGAQFSSSAMPGVDFIIPNTKYLEDNKSKIKGVIFTTSTLEYAGALPFINEALGQPRIYGRHFTNTIIKRRCENKNLPCDNEFIPIEENMSLSIGELTVRFYNLEYPSPDSLNVSIETPEGDITYISTTKLSEGRNELSHYENRKTLCLIADSLNSEIFESEFNLEDTEEAMSKLIHQAEGKVLFATFANNIYHIIKIISLCKKLNKKIILDSETVSDNILAAQEVGLIGNIADMVISAKDQATYKPKDLVCFVSGEEGREMDTLIKILDTTSHDIKVENGDLVVMATHPIIHNQRSAQSLKDSLSRAGAEIIHYKYSEILITQSGSGQDLALLHKAMTPRFFIPVAGCHYMLRVHGDIERRLGTPENHIIIPDNGMIIEMRDAGQRISNTREKVETETIVVDGSKIGKLHNVVLKDREILGAQGVFFIISLIDMRGHKLKKAPDLATRGFVFLKESQELLVKARDMSKIIIEEYLSKNSHIEVEDIKEQLQSQVSKFLMTKTAKQPVVIPIIIRI